MTNSFPHQISHEYGETFLTSQPVRVATISTGQTDSCVTLGIIPVGTTQGHGTGVFEPYLSLYYPQYARGLGTMRDLGERKDPDIEAIKSVHPDLILLNSAGLQRPEILTALQAIAPAVVTKGRGTNWRSDFLKVAEALGRLPEADSWLQSWDHDCLHTRPAVTSIAFIQSNGQRVKLMGRHSFAGLIAHDLGLTWGGGEDFDNVSRVIEPQDLADIDADWIIFGGQKNGSNLIRAMSGWENLRAVQAGKAVEVDYQPYFNNAGPTAARIILNQLRAIIGG
jgi:iron complex transport system substrate-binding protein